MIAGSKQRFARNTADVQAGPAEFLIFLDERGLEPELAGANGRDVPARAGADNYDIKLVHGLRLNPLKKRLAQPLSTSPRVSRGQRLHYIFSRPEQSDNVCR